MKDEIYKILESKVKLLTYASREAYTKEAAEEISEMTFEFMDWVKRSCEIEASVEGDYVWYYIYKQIAFDTSEELYNYWITNIKNL